MKRVVSQSLLNCCLYFLAAYLVSTIHANLQLFQDDPASGTGLSLKLNLMSVLPVLVVAIVLSIVSYFLREDRSRSFATAEFSDSDERNARH